MATTWFSLSGPPGLPDAVVDRLNHAVLAALDLPEVRARLEQEGIDAERMDPATFANFVKDENAHWLPIVRSSVSKPD